MSIRNHVQAVCGAALTALSLEFCYIPHRLMDGGMTGVAVLLGRAADTQPVYVLIILNALCLLVGSQRLGRPFLETTTTGLLTLGLLVRVLGPVQATVSVPAAVLIGGLGVGLGTALILRAGGALDGCEVLGLLIQNRFGLSVVWVLAAANVAVFGTATGMYGPSAIFPSVLAQATAQLVIAMFMMGAVAKRP